MKKALIISIIVLVVASIAFGVSVAVTGVREGQGMGIAIGNMPFLSIGSIGTATKAGDVKEYTFEKNVNDIELVTSVADATVTVADVDKITVKYETKTGGFIFNANVDGDKLTVKEEGGFLLNLFVIDDKESKLEIVLPEKEYDDVEIITASGNTNIERLICRDFESVVASGNSDYDIFATDIDVTTTSGSVKVTNCTDRKANKIKLDSVSGNHTISGFKCDEFKLNSVSGMINADGISGKGEADIVSGEINISYSEWYADLKLNAVSGEFDVTLPKGAGVEVDLDAVSGEIEVELAEDDGSVATAKLTGSSESGKIGGSIVNTVKADLVSGEINIHN